VELIVYYVMGSFCQTLILAYFTKKLIITKFKTAL